MLSGTSILSDNLFLTSSAANLSAILSAELFIIFVSSTLAFSELNLPEHGQNRHP